MRFRCQHVNDLLATITANVRPADAQTHIAMPEIPWQQRWHHMSHDEQLRILRAI